MQMLNAQCGLISGHFFVASVLFFVSLPFDFLLLFRLFRFLFVCDYDFLAFFCFLVTGFQFCRRITDFKNKYVIGRICHDRIKHDIGFLSNAVISKEQIYKCECV
jgi:hypothetical protein